MSPFARLSLLQRLLAGGLVVLLAGTLFVGSWMEYEIKDNVIGRAGLITSLYVDSFVTPHVQSLIVDGRLRNADRDALDGLLSASPLRNSMVAFKIWGLDGQVLYSSTNAALTGQRFPIKPPLASAFVGQVRSTITELTDAEHEFERSRWPRLIETYAPLRANDTGTILAGLEYYQRADDILRDMQDARLRTWYVVSAATVLMFLLLAALMRHASNTIAVQQTELHERVTQLTGLLAQNEQLHERVRRAAARTTALNERFLHRISADLHDGPGQGLALTLMRMEPLADACSACQSTLGKEHTVGDEFRTLYSALQGALDELRAISGGLYLPEIENLSLVEIAERAVRDYERKAGLAVTLSIEDVPENAPLPVKITLFRVLQESLANGFRHANGANQRVHLTRRDSQLLVDVTDAGPGFDSRLPLAAGHLGLAGMRERVEILGGTFGVHGVHGQGTVVHASLPLSEPEPEHG